MEEKISFRKTEIHVLLSDLSSKNENFSNKVGSPEVTELSWKADPMTRATENTTKILKL